MIRGDNDTTVTHTGIAPVYPVSRSRTDDSHQACGTKFGELRTGLPPGVEPGSKWSYIYLLHGAIKLGSPQSPLKLGHFRGFSYFGTRPKRSPRVHSLLYGTALGRGGSMGRYLASVHYGRFRVLRRYHASGVCTARRLDKERRH